MMVFLLNLLSTWFLIGLIWTIQVVHYPLFSAVGTDRFVAYESDHARLITLVVGPLMLLEAATTLLLVVVRPPSIPAWIAWSGVGLLAIVWLSTAFIQVPAHGRLADGFDATVHQRLVSSNWIRTVAWSARGALLAVACWSILHAASRA